MGFVCGVILPVINENRLRGILSAFRCGVVVMRGVNDCNNEAV